MAKIPESLKGLRTFLVRAAEMDRSDYQFSDIVSYALRRYTLQKALKTLNVSGDADLSSYLTSLMTDLETAKTAIQEKYTSDEGSISKEKQLKIVKDLGLKIFKSSDDAYRNGKANKATAKAFYASATYLEVADPEDSQMMGVRKVAKFKAKEILDAVKAGKTPMPPQPKAESVPEEGGDDYGFSTDLPAAPMFSNAAFAAAAPAPEPYDTHPDPDDMPTPTFDKLPVNARLSTRGKNFARQTSMFSNPNKVVKRSMDLEQAEGHTRKAFDFFKKNDFVGGIDEICNALQQIEQRKPTPRMPELGMGETAKLDVMEYLLFAARTLECAGEMLAIPDAKKRAADLLSNALQTAAQG